MEVNNDNNQLRVRSVGTFLSVSGPVGLIFYSLWTLLGNNPILSSSAFQTRVLPMIIVPGLLLLAAAYSFYGEKPWSRHVVLAFFAVTGALMIVPTFSLKLGFMYSALVMIVLFTLGVTFWYLYQSKAVNAYYQQLGGADLSEFTESKAIYVFLVVPFINLLVLTRLLATLLEMISNKVKERGGAPSMANRRGLLYLVGYSLLAGVLTIYLVGLTFSYLALPLTIKADMSAAEKLWQLFVWPFYNHLVVPLAD